MILENRPLATDADLKNDFHWSEVSRNTMQI